MIRHRLAGPMLLGTRALRLFRVAPRAPSFRIVLLHGVPREQMRAFEALVVRLKETHGLLDPAAAAAWLAGDPPRGARTGGPEPCLLTFDDGFVSNLEAAERVLARHGVRALFFVCPGLIDLSAEAQRMAVAAQVFEGRLSAASLGPEFRLMGWEELARLKALGHAVGAHAMTHRRLAGLPAAELEREITGSRDHIAARLGGPVHWFAYPFGNVESIDRAALAAVGKHFRYCRSGVRGPNTAATPPLALLADQVDLEAPPAYQRLVLEGGLDLRYGTARRRLAGLAAGL
jgi:peptidoglycan/xylan/chitin deacetylase (PgdA/CDA1 family)